MRAVLQRVREASVTVDGEMLAAIGGGWLVLVGVATEDSERDADYIADKIQGLRAFADENGKMNLSVTDQQGEVLIISQFTLYGDCRKGRRPSFAGAAGGEHAKALYEYLARKVQDSGLSVKTGRFGADMMVALVNDGPVTLIVDSPVR